MEFLHCPQMKCSFAKKALLFIRIFFSAIFTVSVSVLQNQCIFAEHTYSQSHTAVHSVIPTNPAHWERCIRFSFFGQAILAENSSQDLQRERTNKHPLCRLPQKGAARFRLAPRLRMIAIQNPLSRKFLRI